MVTNMVSIHSEMCIWKKQYYAHIWMPKVQTNLVCKVTSHLKSKTHNIALSDALAWGSICVSTHQVLVHKGFCLSVSGPYHVWVGCEAGHVPGGTRWSALPSSSANHTLTSGLSYFVGVSTGCWRPPFGQNKCYEQRRPSTRVLRCATVQEVVWIPTVDLRI